MKITEKALINKVTRKFNMLVSSNPFLSSLFKKINEEGDVILFGGAVRDFYFNQTPRDYDIVINTQSDDISDIFYGYNYLKNRFGGYKINIDNINFDIWTLPSTWAFHNNLIECNLENISKTVFFNIDSIAVNLTRNAIYEDGFFNALKSNSLEIVLQENPCPELCVLRALYFKHFRFFELSDELNNYLYEWLKTCINPLEELAQIQNSHYGNDYFTKRTLIESIGPYISK